MAVKKTAAEKAAEKAVLEQEKLGTEVKTESDEVVPQVQEKPEVPETETKDEEVVKTDEVKSEEVEVGEVDGDVVAEFTQQLSIFGQLIYNAQEDDTTLIVENLGYGDIYVSEKNDVRVGNESQRLLFKEQKAFKAKKLFLTSASQPVASIIEIK